MQSFKTPDSGIGGESSQVHSYFLEISDREKPGNGAIAWLHVEREEHHVRNGLTGAIVGATLEFRFERLWPAPGTRHTGGDFGACLYLLPDGAWEIGLTSTTPAEGAVYLSETSGLRGHRVGTYFMNEIVRWAKQWPEAQVREIKLVEGDATPDNRERRNRLYEQFGIKFAFTGSAHRAAGASRPMLASQLNTVDEVIQNVFEKETVSLITDLLGERMEMRQSLRVQQNALRDSEATLSAARRSPLRWALVNLVRATRSSPWG